MAEELQLNHWEGGESVIQLKGRQKNSYNWVELGGMGRGWRTNYYKHEVGNFGKLNWADRDVREAQVRSDSQKSEEVDGRRRGWCESTGSTETVHTMTRERRLRCFYMIKLFLDQLFDCFMKNSIF
jgi:hypothetical protein